MNDLPTDIAFVLFEFLSESTDKFRLARTCKVFALASRHPSVWQSLQLKSIGVSSLRSGRRAVPSNVFFLESLAMFISNPRFSNVVHIDASQRYVGEPSFFISTLLVPCCPLLESVNVTDCEPDFSWSFLNLRVIPLDETNVLLRLKKLKLIVYGDIKWVLRTSADGKASFIRSNHFK
jgi:hypothetical protein